MDEPMSKQDVTDALLDLINMGLVRPALDADGNQLYKDGHPAWQNTPADEVEAELAKREAERSVDE